MRRFWNTVLCLLSVVPLMAYEAQTNDNSPHTLSLLVIAPLADETPEAPDLCIDGTLIFREDFGGNEQSDPIISATPVPEISDQYIQDTDYVYGRLSRWHYIITKQGHPDSEFLSRHNMDDHTYPDDMTRGYFFETNSGVSFSSTKKHLYETELAGLCEGMELSFSAYLANVETAQRFKQVPFLSYSYPRFTFLVTDARTGDQLARYNTDTLGHDWSLYNLPDSRQYLHNGN